MPDPTVRHERLKSCWATTKQQENYLQFRSEDALFGIYRAFTSRLRLRVMRDPVMRAMEGGGRCRAGHVHQASTRVVVVSSLSRFEEILIYPKKAR